MHRLHHLHSDTERDPHSPHHLGLFGVAFGQLRSYEDVLRRLLKQDPETTALVADIPFPVSPLNARRRWVLPYLRHLGIATLLALLVGNALIGVAYFLGIMSHPLQGWMVNSLAHRFGYRTFALADESRNNHLVGLLVFGEGYQNNHHAHPGSASFARRPGEVDLGYTLCRIGARAGILRPVKASSARQ
jgi:stearoyl-CoA desaturase (delta-9 desaturase)